MEVALLEAHDVQSAPATLYVPAAQATVHAAAAFAPELPAVEDFPARQLEHPADVVLSTVPVVG